MRLLQTTSLQGLFLLVAVALYVASSFSPWLVASSASNSTRLVGHELCDLACAAGLGLPLLAGFILDRLYGRGWAFASIPALLFGIAVLADTWAQISDVRSYIEIEGSARGLSNRITRSISQSSSFEGPTEKLSVAFGMALFVIMIGFVVLALVAAALGRSGDTAS